MKKCTHTKKVFIVDKKQLCEVCFCAYAQGLRQENERLKKALKKPSKTKKNPKPKKSKSKQFPPPFVARTKKAIKALVKRFRVHDNPPPANCSNCGMKYKNLKTGLSFRDVKDMLWVQDTDPTFWRHKRRGSVLGLWYEIKRSMWQDHIEMCGDLPAQEEYLEDIDY